MNKQLQEDIEWLRNEIKKEDARSRGYLTMGRRTAGELSNPWNDRLKRILSALERTGGPK
ncbi:MAG: hypothetical protein WA133_13210 [Syntrophales bacterium]